MDAECLFVELEPKQPTATHQDLIYKLSEAAGEEVSTNGEFFLSTQQKDKYLIFAGVSMFCSEDLYYVRLQLISHQHLPEHKILTITDERLDIWKLMLLWSASIASISSKSRVVQFQDFGFHNYWCFFPTCVSIALLQGDSTFQKHFFFGTISKAYKPTIFPL